MSQQRGVGLLMSRQRGVAPGVGMNEIFPPQELMYTTDPDLRRSV